MSEFKSYGYSFEGLWSKRIDALIFDEDELIEVLKEISPEQYMVLYNSRPGCNTSLEKLLTEWYIITYPEKAVKLFERMAKRNQASALIKDQISSLREAIKRRDDPDPYDEPTRVWGIMH